MGRSFYHRGKLRWYLLWGPSTAILLWTSKGASGERRNLSVGCQRKFCNRPSEEDSVEGSAPHKEERLLLPTGGVTPRFSTGLLLPLPANIFRSRTLPSSLISICRELRRPLHQSALEWKGWLYVRKGFVLLARSPARREHKGCTLLHQK